MHAYIYAYTKSFILQRLANMDASEILCMPGIGFKAYDNIITNLQIPAILCML